MIKFLFKPQNSYCILIVGTPVNPKEIVFFFFDSIKYKVFCILSVIDVCFKLFHLFNLEYPTESCFIWLFIQTFFYNINTKFDTPCHTLGQILDLSKQHDSFFKYLIYNN